MASFKVFIAESNGPADVYSGRLDGFAANEVLKVSGTPSQYRLVYNREMLERAIQEAGEIGTDIFHLSCHGNETGVELTDGSFLGWDDLADMFNGFADDARILVNSSCGGRPRRRREGISEDSEQIWLHLWFHDRDRRRFS